jgi:Xaa-Pro dipeptidase
MLLNEDRAREVMERHSLDALVATTPENVLYLSDHGTVLSYNFNRWGIAAAVLPRDPDRPPTLVVRELGVLGVHTWMPELRVHRGFSWHVPEGAELDESEQRYLELLAMHGVDGYASFVRLVGQTLDELGLARGRLGFDDARVMLDLGAAELARAETVDATNILREIRVVKTGPEMERMRMASRVNQLALESTTQLAREGVAMGELIRHYRTFMNSQGGYGSHITGGGDRHPWVGSDNGGYRLKPGDHLVLDPAGTFQFYWADQARNVTVGPVDGRFEELYGLMMRCHEEIVPLMRPGATTHDLDERARDVVRGSAAEAGFLPLFHSMGLEQYDQPMAIGEAFTESLTFEAGMAINFESLYFEVGWGSINIEDTFEITDRGAERLGTLPLEAFAR